MSFPEEPKNQGSNTLKKEFEQIAQEDDSERKQLLKEAFILKKDGDKWLVSLKDDVGDPVPVSEEIGRIIVVGIEVARHIETRKHVWIEHGKELAQEDELGLGSDNHAEYQRIARNRSLLGKIYGGLNCHDVVRYILGLPFDIDGEREEYDQIKGFNYKENTLEELKAGLLSIGPDEYPLIGRVLRKDAQQGDSFSNLHSFIVLGVNSHGEVLCFEKVGHQDGLVRLSTLDTIHAAYPHDQWGFLSLADAKRQADSLKVGG